MLSNEPRAVFDAQSPLSFEITEESIKNAKCKDPSQCVIAQGLRAALGDFIQAVEVGASIIKVWGYDNTCRRYGTPSVLRRALIEFDRNFEKHGTVRWNLPVGKYTLLPPCPSAQLGKRPNRWNKVHVKRTGGGQDIFKARHLPTRQIPRATGIMVTQKVLEEAARDLAAAAKKKNAPLVELKSELSKLGKKK